MPRSGLSASSHEMFEAVSLAARPRSLTRRREDKRLSPLIAQVAVLAAGETAVVVGAA